MSIHEQRIGGKSKRSPWSWFRLVAVLQPSWENAVTQKLRNIKCLSKQCYGHDNNDGDGYENNDGDTMFYQCFVISVFYQCLALSCLINALLCLVV